MYYHDSPTVRQIKYIKAKRAAEMKKLLKQMKQSSTKYDPILVKLGELRDDELFVENEMTTGRLDGEELRKARSRVARKRREMADLFNMVTLS